MTRHAAAGWGVSSGVAVGRALLLHAEPVPVVPQPVPPERVEEEIERLRQAETAAAAELELLAGQVRAALGERYAGIFEAQKLMLHDPALVAGAIRRIRVGRVSARWALWETVREFTRRFEGLADPYLRERGGELADVHRRLQRLLRGETAGAGAPQQGPLVAVAHTVGPSDAVLLGQGAVVGLVADVGGQTSHTAILAQALSLPAVIGLHDFSPLVHAGDTILVDGDSGRVVLEPDPQDLARAERRRRASLEADRASRSSRDEPAVTPGGIEVTIRANIEFPGEVERAVAYGARGVGLFRSEFLFLSRGSRFPDEDEHHAVYAGIARRAAPHPATVRTLDLGGEKYLDDGMQRDEPNPALGLRAVRFCLGHPEIFRPQLRGLLRAAAEHPNLRILLPLVTQVDEIRRVRALLAEESASLREAGVRAASGLPLGIMIEVPAAALCAAELAAEVDFLSVGTNDLIQYALAVDRGNEAVAHLYDPLHPAVLRMIGETVEAARQREIPLAVCGEMAADEEAIGLLVGLGVTEVSVQPGAVGRVRRAVRGLDRDRTLALAERLLGREAARRMEHRLNANRLSPAAE